MIVGKLSQMTKGWFVGNFSPSLHKTSAFEVCVKEYQKGEYESCHHHKLASEITVIAYGSVRMNGVVYSKGDILLIEPNEATDFEALEYTITTVVKFPSVCGDKYSGAPND